MWAADPAAERALALDMADRAAGLVGDHAPSLTAIGGAYAQAGSDVPLARTYLDRALALDPSNAWAWIRIGWIHVYLHEVEPALAAFDRAERLSPLDPFLHQITFGRASAAFRWDGHEEEPSARLRKVCAAIPALSGRCGCWPSVTPRPATCPPPAKRPNVCCTTYRI
jgi:tetratricopeptide (TPR) repeat protein